MTHGRGCFWKKLHPFERLRFIVAAGDDLTVREQFVPVCRNITAFVK
jgi:hypothetical protein